MVVSRKHALKRLGALERNVEEHLQKITDQPGNTAMRHWQAELRSWLLQMEDLLPRVGTRTSSHWSAKIAAWRTQLDDR
jgi:hypothetical protein